MPFTLGRIVHTFAYHKGAFVGVMRNENDLYTTPEVEMRIDMTSEEEIEQEIISRRLQDIVGSSVVAVATGSALLGGLFGGVEGVLIATCIGVTVDSLYEMFQRDVIRKKKAKKRKRKKRKLRK